MGGNISPGISARVKVLNSLPIRLPLINHQKNSLIGTDTASAINSGTILGLIYETEGYMRRFRHTIIFTGGDAIYFAEKMKSPIFVVYNLVLIGLAHIADYNAKIKPIYRTGLLLLLLCLPAVKPAAQTTDVLNTFNPYSLFWHRDISDRAVPSTKGWRYRSRCQGCKVSQLAKPGSRIRKGFPLYAQLRA